MPKPMQVSLSNFKDLLCSGPPSFLVPMKTSQLLVVTAVAELQQRQGNGKARGQCLVYECSHCFNYSSTLQMEYKNWPHSRAHTAIVSVCIHLSNQPYMSTKSTYQVSSDDVTGSKALAIVLELTLCRCLARATISKRQRFLTWSQEKQSTLMWSFKKNKKFKVTQVLLL